MYTLESLLTKTGDLPSLPEIYIRVSEQLENEHASAIDIGDTVQTDPSLTARVLKMINSAYYGLPNEITSISQAVSLMGRQLLKEVLMGSVLAGIFSKTASSAYPMREFWKHSVKTAIIARNLAMQNASVLDHEAFFTAGLLHDIGKLVIAQIEPEVMCEVEIREAKHMETDEFERAQLGITHVEVGTEMMKQWGMPMLLIQCLYHHHAPAVEGSYVIETAIIYLANRLSKDELVHDEEKMLKILDDIPSWQASECSVDQISVACRLADEQWMDVMDSLGMMDMEIRDEI